MFILLCFLGRLNNISHFLYTLSTKQPLGFSSSTYLFDDLYQQMTFSRARVLRLTIENPFGSFEFRVNKVAAWSCKCIFRINYDESRTINVQSVQNIKLINAKVKQFFKSEISNQQNTFSKNSWYIGKSNQLRQEYFMKTVKRTIQDKPICSKMLRLVKKRSNCSHAPSPQEQFPLKSFSQPSHNRNNLLAFIVSKRNHSLWIYHDLLQLLIVLHSLQFDCGNVEIVLNEKGKKCKRFQSV